MTQLSIVILFERLQDNSFGLKFILTLLEPLAVFVAVRDVFGFEAFSGVSFERANSRARFTTYSEVSNPIFKAGVRRLWNRVLSFSESASS